jgi:predicted MFS family arabinose efflux permease
MTPAELRASVALAAVFLLRMLGLFMITPVFPLYAEHLEGSTPQLVGIAVGVYGLTQALLQIPFGMASDHIARKKVITAGLLVFAVGSVIAALSTSILGVAVGRALQGAGAVGSATMALAADLTREETRTKSMAIIGMSIGLSFPIAFISGPGLSHWLGPASVFWIAGGLGLAAIAVLFLLVPNPERSAYHREVGVRLSDLGDMFRQPDLLRLYVGVMVLHAVLQAMFLVLPLILRDTLGLQADKHWHAYLPALLLSLLLLFPLFAASGRSGVVKPYYCGSVLAIALTGVGLAFAHEQLWPLIVSLTVFFAGFNFLEACMPSLVTRIAPTDRRGTALGPFSAFQFVGISLGGAIGGWLHGRYGVGAVFEFCALISMAWFLLCLGMSDPQKLRNRVIHVGSVSAAEAAALRLRLAGIPGVAEAVVVADEGTAYLKVDSRQFDDAALQAATARH